MLPSVLPRKAKPNPRGNNVVFLFWGIGSAVFFKIAMGAAITDLSLVGSIVLGGMVAATVFISAGFYAHINGKHQAMMMMGQPSSSIFRAFPILIASVAANIALGKMLVFSFSKKFNSALGYDHLFYSESSFRGYKQDHTIAFMIIQTETAPYSVILYRLPYKRTQRREGGTCGSNRTALPSLAAQGILPSR